MTICDFAACKNPAWHKEAGWTFCERHLTEHHDIAFTDRINGRANVTTSPLVQILLAERFRSGAVRTDRPRPKLRGDIWAVIRELDAAEQATA